MEEEYVPYQEHDVDSGFDRVHYDLRFSAMENRFDEFCGRLDCIDGALRTFENAYNEDMYNLDTLLQSMWIAQEVQLDYFSGQPFVDPRASIAKLEAQRERQREGELAARQTRRIPFSFFCRLGH